MLIGHIKKFPIIKIPTKRILPRSRTHKLLQRQNKIPKRSPRISKKEMKKRNFKTSKRIILKEFKNSQKKNWKPKEKDFKIIKERIISKIKLKPNYYRYYKEKRSQKFLLNLLK